METENSVTLTNSPVSETNHVHDDTKISNSSGIEIGNDDDDASKLSTSTTTAGAVLSSSSSSSSTATVATTTNLLLDKSNSPIAKSIANGFDDNLSSCDIDTKLNEIQNCSLNLINGNESNIGFVDDDNDDDDGDVNERLGACYSSLPIESGAVAPQVDEKETNGKWLFIIC